MVLDNATIKQGHKLTPSAAFVLTRALHLVFCLVGSASLCGLTWSDM